MRTTELQESYIKNVLTGDVDASESLINILPVLICELTVDGRILYVNKTFEDVTGYEMQELSNKNFEEVLHYDLIEHLEEKDRSFPAKIKTKNKTIKTISWSFVELKSDSQTSSFLYSGMEVTEKKKIEEELTFSEKRFKEFFEASLEGIISLHNQKVIDANTRYMEITGFGYEELKAMDSAKDLFTQDTWKNVSEACEKEKIESFEGEIINSGNKILNVIIKVKKMQSDSFKFDMIVLQDITTLKMFEEKLRRESF
jgi:PAS domain S-box-containing protein